MIPKVNNQTRDKIVVAKRDLSRADILRYRREILPELFRIRPGNGPTLPAKRIDDKIRAICAQPGFRTGINAVVQFATAEQIRQAELLRDRGAETISRESANFD